MGLFIGDPQFRETEGNLNVGAWRRAPPSKAEAGPDKSDPGYIKLAEDPIGADMSDDQRYPPADEQQYTLDDLREAAPPVAGGTASRAYAPRTPSASIASSGQVGQVKNAEATNAFGVLREQAMLSGSLSSDPMQGAKARAASYNAQQGTVDAETMMSAGHMNRITSQDSANMRRASQQGMLSAAKRGLQNSSIAAGAAQGAMVDRATPLAQQDAATYYQNMRANVDSTNAARAQNAQLATQANLQNAAMAGQFGMQAAELASKISMQNAEAENQLTQLKAQLETAVNQQNADAINRIQQQMTDIEANISMRNSELETQTSQFNAQSTNNANMQVLQGNQQLNEQYLRGEQAVDLQQIQGRYAQLIEANRSAGQLHSNFMDAIGAAMANHENTPSRIAQYVNVLGRQMQGGLELIDAMNDLGLDPQMMGLTPQQAAERAGLPGSSNPYGTSSSNTGAYNPANNIAGGLTPEQRAKIMRSVGSSGMKV